MNSAPAMRSVPFLPLAASARTRKSTSVPSMPRMRSLEIATLRGDNHLGRYDDEGFDRCGGVGGGVAAAASSTGGAESAGFYDGGSNQEEAIRHMPGTRITDQQVRLYMSKRKHHSQELAAAKAGISVRSSRRIERDARLPSQKPRRYWRSRPDPFAEVWDSEVVPLLQGALRLQAITILRKLQDEHPGRYPDRTRRTLERRVRHWRAKAVGGEGDVKHAL